MSAREIVLGVVWGAGCAVAAVALTGSLPHRPAPVVTQLDYVGRQIDGEWMIYRSEGLCVMRMDKGVVLTSDCPREAQT